jgi:transposase-like protein
MVSLERIIPSDESVPLRGRTFLDWEQQADMMRKAVLPTLLQERAALDATAQVNDDECGKCPRCGSDRIYLDHGGQETQKEVISPHGPVVVGRQQCRCRACGRSFSPSGS